MSELKVVEATNFVAFLPIFVIATGEYMCHPFRDRCQGLLAEHGLKSGLQGCWYCF